MQADQLHLRPAEMADAVMVFAWRNRPEIVALGSLRRTVTQEEHAQWFRDTVSGSRRRLFIIEVNGIPAGQIRFDDTSGGDSAVSIYLLAEFCGRGLGREALQRGCRAAFAAGWAHRIVAQVRIDNARSRSTFERAGFTADDSIPSILGHVAMALNSPPPIPHNRLTFGALEEQAVLEVVRSGVWIGGARPAEVEQRFAAAAGVKHAVAVSSGSSALRLGLLALGVAPGDLVAVPAYSCVALPNAVLACGATPVVVEIEAHSWNMSVPALRATLSATPRIKAAIVVHTFGFPAPIIAMQALGVPVLEDCSHAFGRARFGGMGRLAILSLYATKLLGAGQGGMILTSDEKLVERLQDARDYADKPPESWRSNDKITNCAAALAAAQLQRLPEMLARRDTLASNYSEVLGQGHCRLPLGFVDRVWYRYAVEVGEAAAVTARMQDQGVNAALPVDDWRDAAQAEATPVASAAYRHLISLPLYPTLSEGEQARVLDAFGNAIAA